MYIVFLLFFFLYGHCSEDNKINLWNIHYFDANYGSDDGILRSFAWVGGGPSTRTLRYELSEFDGGKHAICRSFLYHFCSFFNVSPWEPETGYTKPSKQLTCFIHRPHCKHVANVLAKCDDMNKELQKELVILLSSSYEVQKLMRPWDEYLYDDQFLHRFECFIYGSMFDSRGMILQLVCYMIGSWNVCIISSYASEIIYEHVFEKIYQQSCWNYIVWGYIKNITFAGLIWLYCAYLRSINCEQDADYFIYATLPFLYWGFSAIYFYVKINYAYKNFNVVMKNFKKFKKKYDKLIKKQRKIIGKHTEYEISRILL